MRASRSGVGTRGTSTVAGSGSRPSQGTVAGVLHPDARGQEADRYRASASSLTLASARSQAPTMSS